MVNRPITETKKHSFETRKKMSKSQLVFGDNHPMKTLKFRKIRSKKMKGKNNPFFGKFGPEASNWKGEKSFEEYCEIWKDQEYKEDIRKRDNYICQNPDCWGKCNHITLNIHHIDGNKMNCHPWDLISLCCSCNRRAEGNKDISRIWWQEFYQNIMIEKYGYKYD